MGRGELLHSWCAWWRVGILATGILASAHTSGWSAPSDDTIKQAIIRESIASYPGNCPCPYNTASNGSRCGKRSAWSRAGGFAPLCYPEDVTPEMIEQYRKQHPS
jgi:hypothetical protein